MPVAWLQVSIAPLWNWKRALPVVPSPGVGFNRTFMELKGGRRKKSTCRYVVSIAPLWNWKWLLMKSNNYRKSFNRTFMELKGDEILILHWRGCVSIAPLWNWKLSMTPMWSMSPFVSIAPLWNWKRIPVFLIRYNNQCFNRTFMELKVGLNGSVQGRSLFQSHLYGIERTRRRVAMRAAFVSIAPLWNWKVRGFWA